MSAPRYPDPAWARYAACLSADPEAFFAEFGDDPNLTKKAKAICRTCPVITECADYAIAASEIYGVWGGLSPADRKEIRRRSRAA